MPLKKKLGRPFGKRLDLDPNRVAMLPEFGSMNAFATVLGVGNSTVNKWRLLEGMPVEKDDYDRRLYFTVYRDPFIEWAKRTGRIKE